MEGKRRPIRLTAVFYRYLATTGVLMLSIMLLWWAALLAVMEAGWVLPASTAALEAREVAQHCGETGRFSPEGLPHYLRWVRFGSTNELVDSSEMTGRQLRLARAALEEGGCSQASGIRSITDSSHWMAGRRLCCNTIMPRHIRGRNGRAACRISRRPCWCCWAC